MPTHNTAGGDARSAARSSARGAAAVCTAVAAALLWSLLVAASPPRFFAYAAPFCLGWIGLSALAAPPGLLARLRPRAVDVALGVATGLLLYAGSRLFLWAFCGGFTDALCAPLAAMFDRFRTRALLPGLALFFLVAPAEEAFWRGVVQARLATRLGAARAVVVATGLAVLLALATREPFLALATLPTYAAWGALAAWRRSLVPALVSHALWSTLVAVLAPPV
ncbi:CPBP family intramembrane glutamic endopeptidase [Anaeromyxobacter oryzae]|uniref:CPBP family intramembrane glutamic endopeptidase n=1 Tax=Anaeromyxobacter oryzae TaxID=2918170 RepID=UPI0020C091A3|nr:CPBP family intramembrane glutamic endopeptidase [Anaeromyxobacter oryzae]